MNSTTTISYNTRTFCCKQTFKDTINKLIKNRKLNYAHAPKSLSVTLPKACPCSWHYESTYQIWWKSGEKWERYRGHIPKSELNRESVNWRTCAFITSGVIGHRTWSTLLHVWPTFQIWGRPDKNHGRHRGLTVWGQTQTHRQTDMHSRDCIQVYLYNAMHCTRPTMSRTAVYRKILLSLVFAQLCYIIRPCRSR